MFKSNKLQIFQHNTSVRIRSLLSLVLGLSHVSKRERPLRKTERGIGEDDKAVQAHNHFI